MPARTLPGLGLTAYWDLGADGWKPAMDANIRLLSALCQCAVLSRTVDLPASPVDGEMYIVKPAVTNANSIAIRDAGAWVYVSPKEGFIVHIGDTDEIVKWTGSAWAAFSSAGGGANEIQINNQTASHTLVIGDAGSYLRMNVATANTLTVPPNSAVAFAVGTQIPVRQAGVGQTTVAGGVGVTINTAETLKLRKQNSMATLVKVGVDEWDLTGDVELLP